MEEETIRHVDVRFLLGELLLLPSSLQSNRCVAEASYRSETADRLPLHCEESSPSRVRLGCLLSGIH